MSQRPFFVVNPNAANGKLRKRWPEIAAQAEEALGEIDFALTERADHATEIAREAALAGHTLVVACGGDGTINEVVNGLVVDDAPVNPETALGLIPFGTGGDFKKSVGATGSVEQHLHRLARGTDRVVDVGRIDFATPDGGSGTRYFVNIGSAGISGLVDKLVNASSKRLGGKVSFLVATLKALASYGYPKVEVQVDDGPIMTTAVSTVVVANGRFFGGGMMVAPDALLDDGIFDVIVSEKVGTFRSAVALRDMYRGNHLRHDFVHVQRGRVVRVAPARDVLETIYLDVDGEVPGCCPATFTVVEGALRVRAGNVAPGFASESE